MAKLTESDCDFYLVIAPCDIPVRGNVQASGNPGLDIAAEDVILDRIRSGDSSAWCTVKCTARPKRGEHTDLNGVDYLGSVTLTDTYTAEQCATDHGMQAEALDSLNEEIAKAEAVAQALRGACGRLVRQHAKDTRERFPVSSDWIARHCKAWNMPRNGAELAIKRLLEGYAALADASFESGFKLGDDGYFGEYATDMLKAMQAALNLYMGRFDCGALDHLIHALAAVSGVELE